jgi:hypothetical protein
VVEGKEEGKEVGDVVFRNMGSHALKGITRSVHIIQAIPSTLASRSFSAIKTKSIQIAMRRPSGPAPLMKLGKLESYLAGVDGISSPAGTDKQFPSRRVRPNPKPFVLTRLSCFDICFFLARGEVSCVF